MDTQKEIEDMLVAGVINEDDFFGVVKAIESIQSILFLISR